VVLALAVLTVNFWLVTHVDLHRCAKVQSVLQPIKAAFKNQP
jgi:hypothetical protein|tara:strand:- start:128 stop:253 length:126 start_codon:yes stop_codon:yes gene_type:complete